MREECARRGTKCLFAISTDSVRYTEEFWAVFADLPASIEDLFLEFDSCYIHDGANEDSLDQSSAYQEIRARVPASVRLHLLKGYPETTCNIVGNVSVVTRRHRGTEFLQDG